MAGMEIPRMKKRRMFMTDIYSWILSPEIRDYLRGNYRPTLMERQAMIRGAYKPIEEKLSALQELLGEAETEGDRIFLEKVIGVLPVCGPGNSGVPPGRILFLSYRSTIRRRQRPVRVSIYLPGRHGGWDLPFLSMELRWKRVL